MRVAVVGAGRMGRIRAEAAAAAGCRVVAVCDVESAQASALAADVAGSQICSRWGELPWADLDALFVCTPPGLRDGIELAAIEHGTPFLVEKPIGVSLADCSAILQALERRPVVTAVGYMNRYRESIQAARQAVRESQVIAISCDWLGTRYRVPWWAVPELSGGPINEQATHLADIGRFIAGEIETVQCTLSANSSAERCDTAVFNLRFAAGGLFSLLYSCDVETKMIGLRVFTPTNEVHLHGWDFSETSGGASTTPAERNAVFTAETRAFLDAVAGDRPAAILSDYPDAARTQAVVDTMRRAALSGNTERVP